MITSGVDDNGDLDPSSLSASRSGLQFTTYLGVPSDESACPPEYAGVPIRELFDQIDAERQLRAAATANESLAAGFWPRTASVPSPCGSGFESGGVLDTCAPNGSLAGLADATTRDGRLAELDDDELIGVLRAWQRLESWCASGLLTAVAELARRRPADRTPSAAPNEFPAQLSEFISDEIAAALTLTSRTAGDCQDLALDLAARLPGTARALHEGIIDRAKARLIAESTRILTDEQARFAEAQILPRAGQQTTGQLRASVARAVLAVDPEAATRRREEAQKDPRVRRWQEDAGTAALAGYGLPPADVLAADQRLTGRARALRQAGWPGSMEELRARAYLDALLGQDSVLGRPAAPGQDHAPGQAAGPGQDPAPVSPDAPDPADAPAATYDPAVMSAEPAARAKPATPSGRGQSSLASRVTLTVPLTTHLGLDNQPGQVAGYGPVDPALARELTALAAGDPASRFCVTVTGTDGQAIGHGCVPGRPPDLRPSGPGGFTVTISPLARGSCDHRHQEPGHHPSQRLQHLILARTPTCTAPGCSRPSARCDLDHTQPYGQGGLTCECNLGPLCRHHHRCKQSQGWRLEQAEPGVFAWTTPSGRNYITGPAGHSA